MNKQKLIFYGATGVFSLMMIGSATMYFVSEEASQVFLALGFPSYFRIELGIGKYLGVIALLAPRVPDNVREWAYAGFGITLISAAIAHSAVGDPATKIIAPAVAFALLAMSYLFRKKQN